MAVGECSSLRLELGKESPDGVGVVKEVRLKSKFDHDPERFSNGGPSPLVPVEDGLCCGSQRQSLVCSWTVVGNEGMGAGLCTEKEGD